MLRKPIVGTKGQVAAEGFFGLNVLFLTLNKNSPSKVFKLGRESSRKKEKWLLLFVSPSGSVFLGRHWVLEAGSWLGLDGACPPDRGTLRLGR